MISFSPPPNGGPSTLPHTPLPRPFNSRMAILPTLLALAVLQAWPTAASATCIGAGLARWCFNEPKAVDLTKYFPKDSAWYLSTGLAEQPSTLIAEALANEAQRIGVGPSELATCIERSQILTPSSTRTCPAPDTTPWPENSAGCFLTYTTSKASVDGSLLASVDAINLSVDIEAKKGTMYASFVRTVHVATLANPLPLVQCLVLSADRTLLLDKKALRVPTVLYDVAHDVRQEAASSGKVVVDAKLAGTAEIAARAAWSNSTTVGATRQAYSAARLLDFPISTLDLVEPALRNSTLTAAGLPGQNADLRLSFPAALPLPDACTTTPCGDAALDCEIRPGDHAVVLTGRLPARAAVCPTQVIKFQYPQGARDVVVGITLNSLPALQATCSWGKGHESGTDISALQCTLDASVLAGAFSAGSRVQATVRVWNWGTELCTVSVQVGPGAPTAPRFSCAVPSSSPPQAMDGLTGTISWSSPGTVQRVDQVAVEFGAISQS